MELKSMKTLAATSAVALVLAAYTPQLATAQPVTVNATMTTVSGITTTDDADMDFGTWIIQLDGAETAIFTLTDDASNTVTRTGGTMTAASTVVNITPSASEGQLSVATPGAANLTATRTGAAAFLPAASNLAISTVTVNPTTGASGALSTDGANMVIASTAVPNVINIGGTLTASATPPDNTYNASFVITFTY